MELSFDMDRQDAIHIAGARNALGLRQCVERLHDGGGAIAPKFFGIAVHGLPLCVGCGKGHESGRLLFGLLGGLEPLGAQDFELPDACFREGFFPLRNGAAVDAQEVGQLGRAPCKFDGGLCFHAH